MVPVARNSVAATRAARSTSARQRAAFPTRRVRRPAQRKAAALAHPHARSHYGPTNSTRALRSARPGTVATWLAGRPVLRIPPATQERPTLQWWPQAMARPSKWSQWVRHPRVREGSGCRPPQPAAPPRPRQPRPTRHLAKSSTSQRHQRTLAERRPLGSAAPRNSWLSSADGASEFIRAGMPGVERLTQPEMPRSARRPLASAVASVRS